MTLPAGLGGQIRVNGDNIEFEDIGLGAVRTLRQLSDGTYTTNGLQSKAIASSKDMAEASGDANYTGVGFMPTSIICFATIGGADYPVSWGFADSDKYALDLYKEGATSHQPDLGGTHFITAITAGGNQDAKIKTYNADGFTLTWTKGGTPTGNLTMLFLCFR